MPSTNEPLYAAGRERLAVQSPNEQAARDRDTQILKWSEYAETLSEG
jgi:hypothetical protein